MKIANKETVQNKNIDLDENSLITESISEKESLDEESKDSKRNIYTSAFQRKQTRFSKIVTISPNRTFYPTQSKDSNQKLNLSSNDRNENSL